jgi:hypothetical protein
MMSSAAKWGLKTNTDNRRSNMLEGLNTPEDWGVADKNTWVAKQAFSGEALMPLLEGYDVVGFNESASINFAAKQLKQQPAHGNRKQAAMLQKCDPGFHAQGNRCVQGAAPKPGTSPAQRMEQAKASGAWKGPIVQEKSNQQNQRSQSRQAAPPIKRPSQQKPESVAPKETTQKEKSESSKELSKILGQAHSQRGSFLEKRERNPSMYIDTTQVGRGKDRTSIRNYVEKKFADNPKLKDASVQVLEFASLWVDGDGRRISGDTIKEGKTAQDVKQFSLEYQLNNDGSISQIDPSEEGEQRAFRNFGELNSVLEGPIKKALLAAGLTEEDLLEHPPQKPNLKGLSKEDKEIVKKDYEQRLSEYNKREARRNSIAESLSQEVLQEHLQQAERKKFGSPLDFFKDLSPEEQDEVIDTIYPLLPSTLKDRFNKVGSPRKNTFGGYKIENGKKIPVYADKAGPIRGKAMLKKYLVQGGIDGYTHSPTIMSPYSLTLDHVLPSAKGGGDHPDNGVFTRGGLNTHLSDNNFLWLYRSALGEKERLNQLSESSEEQQRLYNDAQKAAYKSQFGTSVMLSQGGTGQKLSTSALNNSRGGLTGNISTDINMISKSITDSDLAEANASSLDPASREVQDFVKKKTLQSLGIYYFGTLHPNAEKPSEKAMSSKMQNLLWSSISSRLKDGSSIEEINDSISGIKTVLSASLLFGTKAGNSYLSKIGADSNSDAETLFKDGINKLSKFLGRGLSQDEISMVRSQF